MELKKEGLRLCKRRERHVDNRKEINSFNLYDAHVHQNSFKCVRDNWHMNHALECNHVRCAGTSIHMCTCMYVGSSNCAMAGLLLLLHYYAHNAK